MNLFRQSVSCALALAVGLWCPGLVVGEEPVAGGKPLSHWVKQLDEGGPDERHIAATMIAELGPKAAPAVPSLAKALESEKVVAVRLSILSAVRRIGPCDDAKALVPALIGLLRESNFQLRHAAADTLAAIGPGGKEAVPALIGCLKHSDRDFRGKCAFALGAIGHAGDDVLAALKERLGDREVFVRNKAVEGLGKLGKAGVPLLIAHALTSLTTKDKKRHAFPAGERFDPDVVLALDQLAKIGPDASEAAPGLIKLLDHARNDYRQGAAKALGAIGPAARAALPTLERMRREDAQAGQAAAEAIKQIESK